MKEPNLLYEPKTYWIKLGKRNHKFYTRYDFEKFLEKVDLSKYNFHAGVD